MGTGVDRDWTKAAVEEVAPGVHRIPLPLPDDGLRAVNVYALADAEAWSLRGRWPRRLAATAPVHGVWPRRML